MRRVILATVGLACAGVAIAPGSLRADATLQETDRVDAAVAVVLRAGGLSAPADGAVSPKVGAFLEPGDRLLPPAEGRLVLLMYDGSTVSVEEPMQVPQATGDTDRLFRLLRALLGHRPQETIDDEEPLRSEASKGGGDHPMPVRPAGDRRVRAITPELVWRAAEGAQAYRVHIWSLDDEVLELDAGADTAWILPPESALTPGTDYTWAVAPLPGTDVGPRARFHVASREILDEVARELGGLRARGLDPEADGLLVAAALFRSMALPYDALAILEDLRERGDPWSGELEAFGERLRHDLADPGLLPEQADPETP